MGKKGKAIWWRWSLVSATLGVLVLTIYYFVAGYMPVADKLTISEGWALDLPWPISRWWDVLIGPAAVTYICFVLQNYRMKEDKTILREVGVLVFSVSLFFSFWGGIGFGFFYGLGLGLSLAICVYFIAVIIVGFGYLAVALSGKKFWKKTWKWLLVK